MRKLRVLVATTKFIKITHKHYVAIGDAQGMRDPRIISAESVFVFQKFIDRVLSAMPHQLINH